jgi:hypothetical protein
MRRPTRPSRPVRSERRRERSDPSESPASFSGIWTRRPSVVTTTATWRRFRPSNRPNAVSRTQPGRSGRFAQSTRRLVIAQPPAPHVIDRVGTTRTGPKVALATRDRPPDATRPPVTRRSRRGPDLGSRSRSDLPALSRFERERRRGDHGHDDEHPEGMSLQHASHQSHQRSPAPIVMAIDARSARAHVRRTRLPFTLDSF